jgi:hypothetical protein
MKSKELTFYIYLLADPRTPEEIRYVGQTVDLNRRLQEHSRNQTGKSHRTHWLNKLHNEGVKPVMIVLNESRRETSIDDMEIVYIKFFRDLGYDLVNTSIGGRVGNRKYLTEEERSSARKEYEKEYRNSDAYKEYRKSDAYLNYRNSDAYKALQKEYHKSYKRKEVKQ